MTSTEDNTEEAPVSAKEEVISFFKTLAVLFVLAVLLRASVVEAFKIPSGSMIPTLRIGDHILVSKVSYGLRIPFKKDIVWQYDSPERGDIVVFTRTDDPSTIKDESADNIIKRVLGIPGDVVKVRGQKVYINDEPIDEPYARWESGGDPMGHFGPAKIPEGHILLLGDNRDHSRDSRFWHEPFLPIEFVKGRALIVYWSWDTPSRIGTIIR